MNKEREEKIEKLLKEMFMAFRSMRPEHDHEHEKEHKGFGPFGKHKFGHFGHNFGHGHRDLFFRLMKEKNGVSVKEIAESLHVTAGAVTQMVDKAIEMGVVTRQEDPKDRRSQIIKLSEKAKDKVKDFRKRLLERVAPRFDNLTDQEVLQLTTLLSKVNRSEKGKDTANG